mmetsp:Transcript_15189/g.37841  ORF Transcript_15189/g.37841 Transcript_15189/m.37841 type:complete len:213 (-) Transcript_15189:751-1389(-)
MASHQLEHVAAKHGRLRPHAHERAREPPRGRVRGALGPFTARGRCAREVHGDLSRRHRQQLLLHAVVAQAACAGQRACARCGWRAPCRRGRRGRSRRVVQRASRRHDARGRVAACRRVAAVHAHARHAARDARDTRGRRVLRAKRPRDAAAAATSRLHHHPRPIRLVRGARHALVVRVRARLPVRARLRARVRRRFRALVMALLDRPHVVLV